MTRMVKCSDTRIQLYMEGCECGKPQNECVSGKAAVLWIPIRSDPE